MQGSVLNHSNDNYLTQFNLNWLITSYMWSFIIFKTNKQETPPHTQKKRKSNFLMDSSLS